MIERILGQDYKVLLATFLDLVAQGLTQAAATEKIAREFLRLF